MKLPEWLLSRLPDPLTHRPDPPPPPVSQERVERQASDAERRHREESQRRSTAAQLAAYLSDERIRNHFRDRLFGEQGVPDERS